MENLVDLTPAFSEAFWSGRRVMVTGHTGFKGSWLTFWLHRLGADVSGYALPPDHKPSCYGALDISGMCSQHLGDIRDTATLSAEISKQQPEIIFHLAAQPLVRQSYDDPIYTFETNVLGTANLLQAARQSASVKTIVIVTTDKCYLNKANGSHFAEDDPLGGDDPYSASKACAELVTRAFSQSFFREGSFDSHGAIVVSARAGNVIGGGDWSTDRLIPDVVRAFNSLETLSIRMPGAIRPWQHVLESLSGYMMLAHACTTQGAAFGGAWNFGPSHDQVVSVRQVVELAQRQWTKTASCDIEWGGSVEAAPKHEAEILLLDSSKANTQLGWQPSLDIETSVSMTLEWYDCYYSNDDPRVLAELTASQIDRITRLTS